MSNTLQRSVLRNSLILGAFALVAALLLGLVNESTRDEILHQRAEAERRALYELLPPATHDNDLLADSFLLAPGDDSWRSLDLLGLRGPRPAYVARLHGEVSGFILPALAPDGYSGAIRLLIGIRPDGSLSGVRVLEHRETPGLGDKIELRVSDWIRGFDERSLVNPAAPRWRVKKDGGDFDQFTGATITPRAVVGAVRRTLEFVEANRERLLDL